MKICMITYSLYASDTRIQQYASALVQRGDTLDVIALRQPGQPGRSTIRGVNVFGIQERTYKERGPLSYLFRILRFLVAAAALVARRHLTEPYQLIHVHSVPDFLVFAALVPKLLGTPIILDIHDLLPEFYASKFNVNHSSLIFRSLVLVERLSIAFADHTIVANDLWCGRVAKRCGSPEKCSPIRNYPLPKLFNPAVRNRNNGRFLITYPGTLNAHQGVHVAIKAFAKVSKQMPDAEFHIYGEGPAKSSLISLADSLGVSDRVIFHHFLLTEEIAQVMANTDLAVEPKLSRSPFGNEALSMKILQFMAVGVPVIASRTKIHQFYYDETLVEFYDDDNYQELAEKILLLRRAETRRQELIRNSLEYVKANNWDIEKKHYLSLVDALSTPPTQRLPNTCSSVTGS